MRRSVLGVLLVAACGEAHVDPPVVVPPDGPPMLSEAGLYADLGAGILADGVQSYTPRYELWSDAAAKRRWVKLPDGGMVDNSDSDFWQFPAGTKFFKEFARDGVVIETRMIHVVSAEEIEMVTYVWKDDMTDAVATPDGLKDALGTSHDVPDQVACEDCHLGEPGRVLGFSAVQLAWDAPKDDVDLSRFTDHLTDPPTRFTTPGTATVAAALGYLHANCGSCHNPNGASWEDTKVHLRLSTTATTPKTTAIYTSTIDKEIVSWRSPIYTTRVIPGDAAQSALWVRMQIRGNDDEMPPIGTEDVDDAGSALVRTWIDGL